MIKKQIYDLSRNDLNEYQIWEFVGEDSSNDDECTVIGRDLKSYQGSMCVVKAHFVLPDAAVYIGYFSPSNDNHLGFIQPTLFYRNSIIQFWYGLIRPDINEIYTRFCLTERQLFPIHFKSEIQIPEFYCSGQISGFGYIDDGNVKIIK